MTQTNNNESLSDATRTKRMWPKALIFIVVIAVWYVLLRISPLDVWLLNILSWIEGLGFWGPFIFVLFYVPSCVLMFPDILPNLAAGAIWGVGIGAIAVSFGRVLGSTVTFLLARRFSQRWQERRMANDPKFAAVAKAVEQQGFRIVVLLRLCPLFPVIMLNYGLGMTQVTLRSYMLGTLLGMIPRTLFVAYAGSGARSLMDLASGKALENAGNPVLYWGGLIVSLIIVIILANKAHHLINNATHEIQ